MKVTVNEHKNNWKNHIENLINVENEWGDCVVHAKMEGPVSMVELKEVETALKHMKSMKVSRSTCVVVGMLITEGCVESLTRIFNAVLCLKTSYETTRC